MKKIELKYGCNPNQKTAYLSMKNGNDLPFEVLNGRPGYINFLDAFNSFQLVKELDNALGLPAASSFKHVSPAGVGVGKALSENEKKAFMVNDAELSPMASAYARARGADRLCSFGDFVALSRECDEQTALLLKKEVSDGIIAPSYSKKALEILKTKAGGKYNVIQIDVNYTAPDTEEREVFGITFTQSRNNNKIDKNSLGNLVCGNVPPQDSINDLVIAMITLKYTQSNSVCYARGGMAIGIGAGQQSRIHCTRLAGSKADTFLLRQHPKVLELPFISGLKRAIIDNAIDAYINKNEEDILQDGVWQNYFTKRPDELTDNDKKEYLSKFNNVSLASDAFFPFSDNIKRAVKSGVKYIVEPGGSIRDDEVVEYCKSHGLTLYFNGIRLFHH